MFDFLFTLLGLLIMIPVCGKILYLITFGFLSETICMIISSVVFGGLMLIHILLIVVNIIEGIFRLFGKDVDIGFMLNNSIKEKKEKKEEDKKLKYRINNQDKIKKEMEDIKANYNLPIDYNLVDDLKLPNNIIYMDNDEKYPYTMQQEKDVKRTFNSNKYLFNIKDNDIYNKKSFYEHNFNDYKEEDFEFIKKFYDINPSDISKVIAKRNSCLEAIKDCLNKATIEAITTKKGKDGENKVAKSLELFKDSYIVLSNIRVVLDGQSSESDFIVICDKGLFAIEVKNHGNLGSTIEISSDGRWTMTKNGYKEVKDNVSEQNNRHCAINQTILNKELKNRGINIDYVKCKSIIVIANDKVELKNNSMNIVVRASEVITHIESLQTSSILSPSIQREIEAVFKSQNLPPNKYPVINLIEDITYAIREYNYLTSVLEYLQDIKSTYDKYIK